MIAKHKIEIIAIGNGTASRETERLVSEMLAQISRPRSPTKSDRRQRGGRFGLLGFGFGGRRIPEPRRLDPRRGFDRPPTAGPARRACEDRTEERSASGSTSTTSTRSNLAARSTAWWKTRSTRSASISTSASSALCWRACRGSDASLAEAIVAHRDASGAVQASRRESAESEPRFGPRAFEQMRRLLAHSRRGGAARRFRRASGSLCRSPKSIVAACGRDLRTLMADKGGAAKNSTRKAIRRRQIRTADGA